MIITKSVFSSADPERKYIIAIAPEALKKSGELLTLFDLWFKKYAYEIIKEIDSVTTKPRLKVFIKGLGWEGVDFLITDIYEERDCTKGCQLIINILESSKNSPHQISIRGDYKPELERQLLNLFSERAHHFLINSRLISQDSIMDNNTDIFYPPTHGIDKIFIKGLKEQYLGNYDGAIELYTEALKNNETDDNIIFALALCYKKKGNRQKYKEYIDKCMELNSSNEAYEIELGNYYLHDKLTRNKAIAIYKKYVNSAKYGDLANWNLFVANKSGFLNTEKAYAYLKTIPEYSRFYITANDLLGKFEHKKNIVSFWTKFILWSAFLITLIFLLRNLYRKDENPAENKWKIAMAILTFLSAIADTFFQKITNLINSVIVYLLS